MTLRKEYTGFIGTPSYKSAPEPETDESITAALLAMREKGLHGYRYLIRGSFLSKQRNMIVEKFLSDKNYGNWLLFCDADMVFRPDHLFQLIRADKDIISALTVKPSPPYSFNCALFDADEKCFRSIVRYPTDGPFCVHAAGTGFLLIKRHVLENIKPPWFFNGITGRHEDYLLGEDFTFCLIAQQNGYNIWVHPHCQIGHKGKHVFTAQDHHKYKELVQELIGDEDVKFREEREAARSSWDPAGDEPEPASYNHSLFTETSKSLRYGDEVTARCRLGEFVECGKQSELSGEKEAGN